MSEQNEAQTFTGLVKSLTIDELAKHRQCWIVEQQPVYTPCSECGTKKIDHYKPIVRQCHIITFHVHVNLPDPDWWLEIEVCPWHGGDNRKLVSSSVYFSLEAAESAMNAKGGV
jgi:hypothetical protein